MSHLVSIIIPTFNSVNSLRETLNSISNQTYIKWESIIVDDGSTDDTVQILNEYVSKDFRFKWYKRPNSKQKGPSSSRNYGIEKANGEFVLFLDSDDLLAANCIENRLAFANLFPDFDFWVFKMNILKNNAHEKIELFNSLPSFNDNENIFYLDLFLRGKFPFVVTCPFWKIESLRKLNGFDERMRMLEDPDLHTRAYKVGMRSKTAVISEPDCFYLYVNDSNREQKSKEYASKAAKTNFYFLNKNWIKDSESVKYNYKRIFNLYVFTNPSWFMFSKMIVLGWKNDLLQIKHVCLALIICLYHLLSLNKVKGLGYTKLRNQFNSRFNA